MNGKNSKNGKLKDPRAENIKEHHNKEWMLKINQLRLIIDNISW